MKKTLNLAIVGHGFVGKAVDQGFDALTQLIDPIYNTSVSDIDSRKDIVFVCVPTPMSDDGAIDSSIVENVIEELGKQDHGMIVLKSTVLPTIVEKFSKLYDNFIYNPEFLTERNYADDFVNPPMHIFGGPRDLAELLLEYYNVYSKCKPCPVHFMTAKEASFVKYTINSFLATKVAWFNELYDLMGNHGVEYDTVLDAVLDDSRIGSSHTKVPGPDGKRWFGGACFKKDVAALVNFASDDEMNILKMANLVNNRGRILYELDERELAQNVNFQS